MNTRPTSPAASDRLPWSWVGEPRGALTLIVAWASFHTLLRLALSSALTADDAREAVLAQSLQWGYQARQPPLYNWLVWAAFRLLGPGILALTLVKYAALALAFWFVYLTGRRILADPRLATLGAFALLLLAPLSWNVHEALTHSVTVLAACAATVYALVRLGDAPSRRTYAGLGLAIGFGLLSKFTFVVFLVAVGLAALTVDRYRRRVLQPAILISALVATVLVLPYAVWFVGAGHDLGRLYAREVHIEDGDAWAGEASTGLAYVLRVAALYLVPVGIALGLCFPGIHRRPPPDSPDSPGGRLLGWLLVWMLVILAGTALAGGLGFLKARWLIPAFFLAPLYGLSRLERHGVPEARLAAFAGILILVEMVIAGGLTARVVGASLFRQPFRMNEPVDAIATGLRRAGFTRGTIVAGFGTLAGNLAVRFPDSRTLHTEYPDFQPPTLDSGQCLVVWDRHPQQQGNADASATPEDVERLAGSLGITLTGSERRGVVEAPFLHDTRRIRRVYYFLFPEGIGRCR